MNNIDLIIDKYLQGNTTIEEEQSIATYLQGDTVADQHQDLIPLFSFFALEKEQITHIDLKESLDKVSQSSPAGEAKVFTLMRAVRSLAAVMLVAAGAYFAFQYIEGDMNTQEDKFASIEVEDTDEALEVTLEALAFLSNKLDKNSREVRKDMQHADSNKFLN